jgi:large subunit ribosomal protein L29
MRAEEIREMSPVDIAARVKELEEERFRLKFRSATEPLEDPLRLRVIRKDIARLNTVLREQQMKGTAGAAGAAPAGKAAAKKTGTKTAAKKTTAKRAAKKSSAAKKRSSAAR